jgi:hypothetical protein
MTAAQTSLTILTYHVRAACSTIAGLAARPLELGGPQPTQAQVDELREALLEEARRWYTSIGGANADNRATTQQLAKMFQEFRLSASVAQAFSESTQAIADAEKDAKDAGLVVDRSE